MNGIYHIPFLFLINVVVLGGKIDKVPLQKALSYSDIRVKRVSVEKPFLIPCPHHRLSIVERRG